MPDLSIEYIERISREVKRQEITFSSLADELIDHICCEVENEMQEGLTFYEAFRKVKQNIGPRRLKEIQEETLYAIDTKYRFMKNSMKISGVAGTILFGLAALFKIQHWAGAGIMLTLGAVILAFVFMPSALGVLWKETHSKKRLLLFISAFLAAMFFILGILFKVQHWNSAGLVMILSGVSACFLLIPLLLTEGLKDPDNKAYKPIYILGAIGLVSYIAGFMCKIMHWPGAGLLLMGGLFILFIIVFPWYTIISWRNEKYIKPEFIFLVAGSLAIILPSALLSLNLQRSFDKGYFDNQEQQRALYNYLYENIRSNIVQYHDSSSYPFMEQLNLKTVEILTLVSSIESEMIGESEGAPGNPVENPSQIKVTENGTEIDFNLLHNPFHIYPVQDFLLPGTTTRSRLEAAMTDYKIYLSGILPVEVYKNLEPLLDPSIYLPVPASGNRRVSMISGLHSLALLKNGLLTAESFLVKYFTEK